MNHIRLYENFAEELFDVPVFYPLTDDEDNLFLEESGDILKEFEGKYFELDEPSTHFGSWNDSSDLRCHYWLTSKTMPAGILNNIEFSNLKLSFPDEEKTYKYREVGIEKERKYKFPKIFGHFFWYSIPVEPKRSSRREMYWVMAKDSFGKFRAINGEMKELRNLWNSAKKWNSLEDLIKSETPTLKSIGKYFNDHVEFQRDEWESEETNSSSDDRYDYYDY
jgi:hypothetical protein